MDTMDSKYLHHIQTSLITNYKSWSVLFLSCIITSYQSSTSIFFGWIQFLVCILFVYGAHRIAHEPIGFFLNRAHIYHHEHADWMSHAIQVCVEIAAGFSPVFLLYYLIDLPYTIPLVDPYIFLLFSVFYTSVHNVNYGQLHVNKVHAKHHADYSVNYGPDICDIIFKTKFPPNEVENTDHYIPNILVATIVTTVFRYFYEKSNKTQKTTVKKILTYLYICVCSVVMYFTVKKTALDLLKLEEKELHIFQQRIDMILFKLNKIEKENVYL